MIRCSFFEMQSALRCDSSSEETPVMTCPRCKKPLPKGAMRCPQCARGRAIPRSKQSAQKPVILVVVVLAVVGIAAYFVFATSNSAQPEQSARKPNTPTKRD